MQTFTVTVTEDQYRKLARLGETPQVGQTYPDQWVDWGDHTVQIDPIGNKQWIYDSNDGHVRSENRGRYYDARDVNELRNWEDKNTKQEVTYYTPTFNDIKSLDKFTQPMGAGCRMWRGGRRDGSRFGKLPSVTAMLRDEQLGDKAWYDIEAEIRESERTKSARLYSRD